jgi:hypothetical protein
MGLAIASDVHHNALALEQTQPGARATRAAAGYTLR